MSDFAVSARLVLGRRSRPPSTRRRHSTSRARPRPDWRSRRRQLARALRSVTV